MTVMAMPPRSPQRGRQFADTDRAVTISVQLAENMIGLRNVGSTGAKRVFEFRFCDLAVTVAIDLREQALQSPPGFG
jgi:hypothetical protein